MARRLRETTMTRNRFWKLLMIASSSMLVSAGASADMVTLNFNYSFGDTPASGGDPWWVQATIKNGADAMDVAPGNVLLTITASAGLGAADITQLYFNFDGLPNTLSFNPIDVSAVSGYVISNATADSYHADGDGYYDFLIDLPTANTPAGARFSAGESISFVVSGAGALSPNDFYLLSAPGDGEGNPGPFYAAAHIQSTGPYPYEGSDWVAAVPIPAAIWLFGSALGMLGLAARRRRQSFAAA